MQVVFSEFLETGGTLPSCPSPCSIPADTQAGTVGVGLKDEGRGPSAGGGEVWGRGRGGGGGPTLTHHQPHPISGWDGGGLLSGAAETHGVKGKKPEPLQSFSAERGGWRWARWVRGPAQMLGRADSQMYAHGLRDGVRSTWGCHGLWFRGGRWAGRGRVRVAWGLGDGRVRGENRRVPGIEYGN